MDVGHVMEQQSIFVQDSMVSLLFLFKIRVIGSFTCLGTILSLAYDATHHCLTENWLRHWSTNDGERLPSIDIAQQATNKSNTFIAGSTGYEFIVCTSVRRHVFAVLQPTHEHVRIHQLNLSDGHLLNDLKLDSAKVNQTFLCGTTQTLFDTTKHLELFAIGLQSGLIFVLATEPLHIHATINGM
jgi:hypothetical protein